MFLTTLRRRNPAFILAAQHLHQQGHIPANSYVIDLDAVEANARLIRAEADRHGLKVFAMTKQVSRNSGFCRAVMRGGIDRAVAVDMACATACHRAGLRIGHLGHLVQVPRGEADHGATVLQPDYWTVFSPEKAAEAAKAAPLRRRPGSTSNRLAVRRTATHSARTGFLSQPFGLGDFPA